MAININSIDRRDAAIGQGTNISFWLDDESEVDTLPLEGGSITVIVKGAEVTVEPALTSTALVKSTGNCYALGVNGWEVLG